MAAFLVCDPCFKAEKRKLTPGDYSLTTETRTAVYCHRHTRAMLGVILVEANRGAKVTVERTNQG